MSRRIVLGTRGSRLALRQTQLVRERLHNRHPDVEFAVHVVSTQGDRIHDRPISHFGDKGVFVRALEVALLEGTVDLAVHSLKDVPGDDFAPGLVLAAFSAREDPRDVVISRTGATMADLPAGARIGTGSLRRRVQLHEMRQDLNMIDIRGNVDTRLRKVRDGEYDAIVLAAAGMLRLDLAAEITEYLPFDCVLPDAGQGIITVQARVGDPCARLAATINDSMGRAAALAERAVVQALHADCKSPVGAYAAVEGNEMVLRAVAASHVGSTLYRAREEGSLEDAETIGRVVGLRLLAQIAA